MNSLLVLVALLVLSHLGGMLSAQRASWGFGWASGIEFVILGVVVGPLVLGFFRHDTIVGFEPLLVMVLGWLVATMGMQYGRFAGERVPGSVFCAGILIAVLTGLAVGGGVYSLCRMYLKFSNSTSVQLGLAIGAVSSGSAHQAVRWASRGVHKLNSTSQLLGGIGSADDLPPLIMLAVLGFVAHGPAQSNYPLWVLPLLGLGLGVVLGATVAALLGPTLDRGSLWPVLLGAVLLVVGVSLRLDLPILTPVFLTGLTLSILSPHRRIIRQLVTETERPLLVPALLLAGALVDLPKTRHEWLIVAVALVTRLSLQFLLGTTLPLFFRAHRGHGTRLGQALLSTGGASLAIGLAVFFRHPGVVGRVVLFVAVTASLIGELFGGRALRKLVQAEELDVQPGAPEVVL